MNRVTLTNSNVAGWWRVSLGEQILFTGGRVDAKQFADTYCRDNRIRSWWDCKRKGVWVEIPVGVAESNAKAPTGNPSPTLLLLCLLAIGATASAAPAPTHAETVAAVLVAEAGGHGPQGMRAVREVVQMRAWQQQRSEVAVVTARLQFSCLNRTTPARLVAAAKRHPKWTEALTLASSPVATATVWQANHYHALTVLPRWAKGQRPVAILCGHAFYRL